MLAGKKSFGLFFFLFFFFIFGPFPVNLLGLPTVPFTKITQLKFYNNRTTCFYHIQIGVGV